MFLRIISIAAITLATRPLWAAPPNVERISPATGQRGTSFQLTVVGAGLQSAAEVMLYDSGISCERLEAGSDNELVLHLKASPECSTGRHSLRIRSSEGVSELHVFSISPLPVVAESESNNVVREISGTAVELPIALNGILQEPGDVDCFRIRAEAGQKIDVGVFASRLGSPIDSLLEIHDLNGELIGSSDDGISHDSHLAVTFPATGEYVVQITDKRGNGGEDHFYRVELSPFLPQLTAFLSRPDRRSQERQTIVVPRGNRVLTFLACQRTGFIGHVSLVASGLPEGVRMPATLVPSDRYWVPMVIEAADDAPIAGTLVDVEASGVAPSGTVLGHFRQVVDLVAASADQLFYAAEEDRLAVAVVEEVPYSITLKEPATSLAPDGTLELQINAVRAEGFDGPLDVSFPFLPAWVDGPEKVTIPKGESRVVYKLRAWSQAKSRIWQICAKAKPGIDASAGSDSTRSAGGAQMMRPGGGRSGSRRGAATSVASNLVNLSIETSPVSGSIGTIIAEQGKTRKVTCSLLVSGSIPESLTAVLEGLPNRVAANDVNIDSKSGSVEFEMKPEPSCPVGEFPDLIVRLSGQMNGQDVSWRIGRGGVLRIEAAGMLFTDDKGQPLSRLEVLRREAAKQ